MAYIVGMKPGLYSWYELWLKLLVRTLAYTVGANSGLYCWCELWLILLVRTLAYTVGANFGLKLYFWSKAGKKIVLKIS